LLVYDNVWSIVPAEAGYEPSVALKRHLEKLPDTFSPIAPQPADIVSEYFVLSALGKAFQRIAGQPNAKSLAGKFRSNDDEEALEIEGIAKVHGFKIASVVLDKLRENGLVYGEADGGFFRVNEEAAYLIVSFLAHRMARRLPVRTITDMDSAFVLSTACDVIEAGNPSESTGLLAASVLRFHIPQEIGKLPLANYVEIRKRYETLREEFPLYLHDLGELVKIGDARSANELRAKINDLVKTMDRTIARIKRARISQSIKRWVPIGLASAVTVGAACLPLDPTTRVAIAGAASGIQILRGVIDKAPIRGRLEAPHSLLLSAKRDILRAHEVHEMAAALSVTGLF
jgi:hypothetical protein